MARGSWTTQPGDVPQFDGLFKAPSVRNVDQRPYPGFVRSYMHNGVFKSLEEVVHFYNKRSVATNSLGQEMAFDWSRGPPAGYTPIFPPPESMEYPANVQNIAALTPAQFAALPPDAGAIANNGQVGNLQLTPQEEADLVSFLKTLTDGYIRPNAVSQDLSFILQDLPSPPAIRLFCRATEGGEVFPVCGADLKQSARYLPGLHEPVDSPRHEPHESAFASPTTAVIFSSFGLVQPGDFDQDAFQLAVVFVFRHGLLART